MKPSRSNIEEFQEIIEILGEDKIEELYLVMGSSKLSVATLHNFLKRKKIIKCIRDGLPFGKIASSNGVSKMTVYRYLKNGIIK